MGLSRENRSQSSDRRGTAHERGQAFHLRLPDLFAAERPRTVRSAPPRSEEKPSRSTVAVEPVAQARQKLSHKRYRDGKQQVAGIIEDARARRRKLFGRLWIASVTLTALSIVALAIELIQGLHPGTATGDAIPVAADGGPIVRKSSSRSPRRVVPAVARKWSNESPGGGAADGSVQSALYTMEGDKKPNGVWLDGTINESDSETPNH